MIETYWLLCRYQPCPSVASSFFTRKLSQREEPLLEKRTSFATASRTPARRILQILHQLKRPHYWRRRRSLDRGSRNSTASAANSILYSKVDFSSPPHEA